MVFLTQINGPLSSHVPSDESVGQLRGIQGVRGVSAESAASEEKKRGPYNK